LSKHSDVIVDIDECLLRLRESLNNTARNVVYEDNKRIGRILQGYVVLRTEIDFSFERFMRNFIGGMTYEVTRAYSAPLAQMVGNETVRMQKDFHPSILTDIRAIEFDFLFDSLKFSLDNELQVVRDALNSKPEASSCWPKGKEMVCELVKSVSDKIVEIFRVDARDSKKDYDGIANAVEQLGLMIEGGYGHRCVNEDSRDNMMRCVWEAVSF
jgi:hypothetical protein